MDIDIYCDRSYSYSYFNNSGDIKFGMVDLFCDIETGLESGPNKTEAIQKLLTKYSLQPNEFYYVGDAVSDIKAAQNADVVCLSAAWGDFADIKELSKLNTENIFFTTEKLLDFFLNCNLC